LLQTAAQIVAADVADAGNLAPVLRGASVIVSALQGGPDVIIVGQRDLALACRAEGVACIFPSDFAVDFSRIPVEDHLFLG
jgi:hypothetical protein